jgi:hypothetical protein
MAREDSVRNVPAAPTGHQSFRLLRNGYFALNGKVQCACGAEHALVDHSSHLATSGGVKSP